MSLWAYNNTFPEIGKPTHVFECVVGHSISGLRLNPLNLSQRIEFIVDGGSALLDDRLVELYSEEEYRFFIKANARVIEEGALAPVGKKARDVDTFNAIDDDEVERIALLQTTKELEEALAVFTSPVPVWRVLQRAEQLGRSKRFIDVMKRKYEELSV